jgi:alginate O-acetyltransferase complex protein AlgI
MTGRTSKLLSVLLCVFLIIAILAGFDIIDGWIHAFLARLSKSHPHLVFTSPQFLLVALPLALLCVFGACRLGVGLWAIIVVSFGFYLTWGLFPFAILCSSILVNFTLRHAIIRTRPVSRHYSAAALFLCVCFNIILLGYFKYAGFFTANLNTVFSLSLAIPNVLLPIGISFYTFQEITLAVDAYRGHFDRRFSHYVAFITFFPHLISGPLLHHKEMVPQFSEVRVFSKSTYMALSLLAIGAFKKLWLADPLASVVAAVFDSAQPMGALQAWEGALAYSFQLYFDFSGYSDIAMALGLFFNIKLPVNFFSPYKSASIIEFWRRWHMTLARFLREYLYFPLGGNRKGPVRRYANLMIVMLIGGLWHGAAWTFVAWGGLHGLYLIINHAWTRLREYWHCPSLPAAVALPLTFAAVAMAWVVFRAPDMPSALILWKSMLGMNGPGMLPQLPRTLGDFFQAAATSPLPVAPVAAIALTNISLVANGLLFVYLLALYLFCLAAPNSVELVAAGRLHVYGCPAQKSAIRVRPTWAWGIIIGILLGAVIYASFDTSPTFLYWNY